jgi:hypothetical protein
MQTPSTHQRIAVGVLEGLRTVERTEKRKASVSGTVDYLIKFQRLTKKLDSELYQIINSQLNASK